MTPAVIEVDANGGFDSIPTGDVLALLDASGAVLLRGDATPDTLDRLSRRFCDRFTCDPGKVVTGGLRGRGDTLGRAARIAARSIGRAARRPVGDRASQQPRYAPFGGFGINPHSENAFLPAASPDLVWFLCERPADSGGDVSGVT